MTLLEQIIEEMVENCHNNKCGKCKYEAICDKADYPLSLMQTGDLIKKLNSDIEKDK